MSAQTLADGEPDGVATLYDGDTTSDDGPSQELSSRQGGKEKILGDSFKFRMQSICRWRPGHGCSRGSSARRI
ncbi:hypothetical protein GN958_ATG01285 [Phytophthora infestans]|uniref:Uncharacterized protein n=1 Tax=Phytophthora infestans TaxID=4787 RepID=A0A8S9VDU2_PHYIN|nr:hypothetical protein GN958_ATG01285 [Phytophthora infestans]